MTMESNLERNIRKYPKLKKLLTTELSTQNKFLSKIFKAMHTSSLTYKQAVTACKVIDEETINEIRQE
jgi:hypothetical protein